MGQSDPIDVGTSSKWDRGYTKTGLSPGASFEFTGPRENVPNICPLEGMLTQRLGLEPQPVAYLSKRLNQTDKERLTSLPLKPCSDWSSHRRCLKTLSWGYAIYFYQQSSEITSEWEMPFVNIVHTRTQEKGATTPQKTDPNLPVSVQEYMVEAWVGSSMLHSREHWVL